MLHRLESVKPILVSFPRGIAEAPKLPRHEAGYPQPLPLPLIHSFGWHSAGLWAKMTGVVNGKICGWRNHSYCQCMALVLAPRATRTYRIRKFICGGSQLAEKVEATVVEGS